MIILFSHLLLTIIFFCNNKLSLSLSLSLILSLLTRGNYFVNYNINMTPLNLTDRIAFKVYRSLYKKKLISTKSSSVINMLGSYGTSSKQAYKLSFTVLGKTQNNHLPGQPYSVICFLLANLF